MTGRSLSFAKILPGENLHCALGHVTQDGGQQVDPVNFSRLGQDRR